MGTAKNRFPLPTNNDKPGDSRPAVQSEDEEQRPKAKPSSPLQNALHMRVLRSAFYLFWLFILPFGLAVATVWVLTPPPNHGGAGGLRVFVGEQQIPSGIVLFTIFALIVWSFRHDLPFATLIGVGGRRDIPQKARLRFEEAGALLEEAHRITRVRKRDMERELTASEREQLKNALEALDRSMTANTFDLDEFDKALVKADRLIGEYLGRWRKSEMREYAESIGIAVFVALVLRAFVVEAFKIPSGSMIPTLAIGDHIFVNKFAYGPLIPWTETRLFSRLPPERGDVMVFKFPENMEQDFIKRTIALPGDTLEAIDGRPVINGWLVPNCYVGVLGSEGHLYLEYLEDKAYLTLYSIKPHEQSCSDSRECSAGLVCRGGACGFLQGPYKVRPNEAWVMGDNRNNSHDSRLWRGGLGAGVPFENIKGRALFVWMSFGPGGGVAQDRLFVNVMGRPQLPPPADGALEAALERCLKERPAQTSPPPPKAK